MRDRGGVWHSGFTLLELAVAGALGALLLSAVVVMSARGMAAWRRTDSRLQLLFHLERGLSRMGEDLRNGTVPADVPFHGAKDEMGFAVAEDSTHLAQVRYRLVGDSAGRSSWVRERMPFPGGDSEQVKAIFSGSLIALGDVAGHRRSRPLEL